MVIKYAACSHIGYVREKNEDNLYVNGRYKDDIMQLTYEESDMCDRQGVFAVFDGMGGEHAGEIASLKAAQLLDGFKIDELLADPQRYVHTANEKIYTETANEYGKKQGTTAAVLAINENSALIANVGDSRIYYLNKNDFTQLSKDHNMAQQMVDAGILSEDEAKTHHLRNVLTQHLGIHPSECVIEPYINKVSSIACGDIFLLCSDGLTSLVSDEDIENILRQEKDLKQIANDLIKIALELGGKDNITVIVVKAEVV